MRNSAITRLGILTLAHVVGNMQLVSVMAIAPILQRDLDVSVTQLGLLITAWWEPMGWRRFLPARWSIGWGSAGHWCWHTRSSPRALLA